MLFFCFYWDNHVKWSRSVLSSSLLTPWTVANKAPLSMEFSRQEYWSGLPFPSPNHVVFVFSFVNVVYHIDYTKGNYSMCVCWADSVGRLKVVMFTQSLRLYEHLSWIPILQTSYKCFIHSFFLIQFFSAIFWESPTLPSHYFSASCLFISFLMNEKWIFKEVILAWKTFAIYYYQ